MPQRKTPGIVSRGAAAFTHSKLCYACGMTVLFASVDLVIGIMVALQLIGLTIAAYVILRRK
jgi:hypothetical protein